MSDNTDIARRHAELAFAVWIATGTGSPPDIGGSWYRYVGPFASHYDDAAFAGKGRHVTVDVYPDGRLHLVVNHGPRQEFRTSRHATAADALRAGLDARAAWMAGEPCRMDGCPYCAVVEGVGR